MGPFALDDAFAAWSVGLLWRICMRWFERVPETPYEPFCTLGVHAVRVRASWLHMCDVRGAVDCVVFRRDCSDDYGSHRICSYGKCRLHAAWPVSPCCSAWALCCGSA